jgi:hypothetical protein
MFSNSYFNKFLIAAFTGEKTFVVNNIDKTCYFCQINPVPVKTTPTYINMRKKSICVMNNKLPLPLPERIIFCVYISLMYCGLPESRREAI